MKRTEKKAAIYGGSFDPPHLGHLAIMKKALETLDIDKLIVVPAFVSPFKQGHVAPAPLRLRWLKKIAAMDPRIVVSDFEIKRGPPSYTVDTVEHFKQAFDTIYLIVGADNLESLPHWHDFEKLDKMVTWVVATRQNRKIPDGYITLPVDIPISSTELRKQIRPEWIPASIREEVVEYYSKRAKEPH